MRFDITTDTPDLFEPLVALNTAVTNSGLEPRLIHLVKLRASQINGCAYCVDMHSKEATRDGIDADTLHHLPVWWESSRFSPRDKAALAWTESVTHLAATGVPDDAHATMKEQFDTREIAALTVTISLINAWNRIGVSAHMTV